MLTFEQTQKDVAEVKKDVKKLIALILNKAKPQTENNTPLNINDVANLTGYTKPTIYSYCQKNEIPYHKKNGRLFFFKPEIIDWIKQGKQKTILDIEEEADSCLKSLKRK
ncbi:helix-turn-helix domain-containing protein [Winogradskyella psychrotolerans]|uniref:helix-turn-helix domain-containing protein n=1 Tax=Winogradskyella psychrotolerans TaxID=1344585 RepID=UPI001C06C030|nr:helix-turn-helix domain-containing protein [Winogradskyella psychrotolerans]MBU2921491.1 helix-turn-helix domain-containing protein [Winogradskyella psychrotolerans]